MKIGSWLTKGWFLLIIIRNCSLCILVGKAIVLKTCLDL